MECFDARKPGVALSHQFQMMLPCAASRVAAGERVGSRTGMGDEWDEGWALAGV